MATVKLRKINSRQFGGLSPYGNATTLIFPLATTATGAAVDGNSTAALAIADVVDLGQLPAGFKMDDSILVISNAMSASVTASLGFKYEDGVDVAAVPQDAAYFGTGIVMSSAARLRNTSSKALVTLPKNARLILTIAGANNTEVAAVEFIVKGELVGPA